MLGTELLPTLQEHVKQRAVCNVRLVDLVQEKLLSPEELAAHLGPDKEQNFWFVHIIVVVMSRLYYCAYVECGLVLDVDSLTCVIFAIVDCCLLLAVCPLHLQVC